ncbi:MAG: glycosyltransferase family 4 protein [Deltaproteobacteria bacterium]|nr:glycosyltransferase family 4 protein [Deltaproteobacteria bacterium]
MVAISQGVRSALITGGAPAARIHLIPSGVDTARFAPDSASRHRVRTQHHIAPQTPLIVSVGALVDRKDHITLLTAAHLLKTQGYTLRCLISGEGPLRSALEAQTRTLGLTEEVSFTGFCADIPGLLSAADFFVHTPLYEGLGVAVMEAVAAGLPTIASRVGGIPELIEDEKTGLLVPPHDAEALSAALSRLLSHPQFARQLGKTGQSFAKAHFDIAVMARTNEALYLDMIADTP